MKCNSQYGPVVYPSDNEAEISTHDAQLAWDHVCHSVAVQTEQSNWEYVDIFNSPGRDSFSTAASAFILLKTGEYTSIHDLGLTFGMDIPNLEELESKLSLYLTLSLIPVVYNTALKRDGDDWQFVEDALSSVYETFRSIIESERLLTIAPDRLSGYLIITGCRTCYRLLNLNRKAIAYNLQILNFNLRAADFFEAFELIDEIQRALACLSETDRTIFLMAENGFLNEEIAQHLGVAKGAAQVRLYRIRQKLMRFTQRD